jgi:hypothetical protein
MTRIPDQHDPGTRVGGPALGIAIGLTFTAALISLAAIVFAPGAWQYIGALGLMACIVFLANVAAGE